MTLLVILNGPEMGRTLRIRDGVSYLGRSLDNDIRINDKTISRKHLRIESIRNRHFITDLSSRNGTFYKGKYVIPGDEVEVVEGIPMAIGMTVICFGEGCKEQIVPFLDTVNLLRKSQAKNAASGDRRVRPLQKRAELLSKVSLALKGDGDLKRILEKVLDHIFQHLKRLDRGAFVLVDPETLQRVETICRVSKSSKNSIASFSEEVVRGVLKEGKPLVFSKGYTEEKSASVGTLKVQKVESALCVPLVNGQRIVGAMYVDSVRRPDGFRRGDSLILLDIAQRVALAVESDRLASDLAGVTKSLIGSEP